MATQLTMVNNLLRRLREDPVSTVSENDYSTLMAMFINDAKADLEDIAYDWTPYITTITTSILDNGTREYTLTGTNSRSWLMRQKDDRLPMAFDVTADQTQQLRDISFQDMAASSDLSGGDQTEERPSHFALSLENDNYVLNLPFASSTERTWKTYWYVPQDDLSVDTNDDAATELLLPRRAIELRALFYALEERGEVMGPREASQAWLTSVNAIAAALENDMQAQRKWEHVELRNGEYL